MQLVRDWLEAQSSPGWLMIVDNVDDRTMFFEQVDGTTTDKRLIEYIPQAAKGSVIYTTRSRDVGIDLASGDEPIEVSPMDINEGLIMLGDGVTRGSTKEDQEALLEELAYLPLAISQATAYMVKRRRSIADYVRLLQNESTRTRVLDHRTLHHGRQDRSSESVTRTWWITFQWLKKEHPRSAELLTMMSLLDRQQIPLALVQDAGEDTFDFEEAIGILEGFSLIHLYPYVEVCEEGVIDLLFDQRPDLSAMSSEFCDMHRLVQASTREWLSRPENDKVHIATKTIVSVSEVFPLVNVEDLPLCHILYSHADAVLAYNSTEIQVPRGRDGDVSTWNMRHRASLLLRLSEYLREQGHLAASEHRVTLSLEICQLLFDPDDSEQTMDSMESLAISISMLGRGAEALEMHRKILEGRERLLGPNHKSTVNSLNHVGFILRSQGECAEAEDHHRRALALGRMLHEQDLFDSHLIDGVIIALHNVAHVLNDQGEFEEAQTLLQEAFERSQDAHGRDHHLTWAIMASLANRNVELAKYEEAHALFAEVLAGQRRIYGETHHATLNLRGHYTMLLEHEGNYAKAEEEIRSVLEDELLVDGVEKRNTLFILGRVLRQQKKYEEAEKIYKHLLELQERARDNKPSAKARDGSLGNGAALFRFLIAMCLIQQGKTDEAKQYQTPQPYASTTEHDVEEAKVLYERSLIMYNEGQYKEAEGIARKELEIRMEHAGLDNDRTQTCLFQIARALHKQNAHFDSQSLARRVLAYRKRKFGWRNGETLEALGLLAVTTLVQGKLEEAEGYYRQMLLWIENSGGKFDVESCDARWDLANVLARQRKYPEAEKLFRFNLELQLDDPFSSNPKDIANTYHNLACVLQDQSHNAEAEACFQHAYDREVELYGHSDARSTTTLAFLAEVVAEQGKCQHAEELYLLLGETLALPQSEDEDSDENTATDI